MIITSPPFPNRSPSAREGPPFLGKLPFSLKVNTWVLLSPLNPLSLIKFFFFFSPQEKLLSSERSLTPELDRIKSPWQKT